MSLFNMYDDVDVSCELKYHIKVNKFLIELARLSLVDKEDLLALAKIQTKIKDKINFLKKHPNGF